MKIIDTQYFRGRNIYCHRPVVKLIIDLEEYYDIPTMEISGFNENLIKLLPGLKTHYCSLGYEGGFVERLKEGTYLGHVAEHIILELQSVMGYDCNYGKTRVLKEPNLYYIVYEYKNEVCAIHCAHLAVKLVNSIINQQHIDLEWEINRIEKSIREYELGPSTKAIVEEAEKRGFPVIRLGNESLIQIGYGKYQRRMESTITDTTSCIAVDTASNKMLTKQILNSYNIPVPMGDIVRSEEEAVMLAKCIGFPVVVKPYDGNQGKGVAVNLVNEEQVREAFRIANELRPIVMVEEYVPGNDYRVLVVGDKVSAVSQRCAACVVGDGIHSIKELIHKENNNKLRGEDHEKPLTQLKIDDVVLQVLSKQNFTIDTIPLPGQVVKLRENGNLSTGGTAIDQTARIHPYNAEIAVKAAQLIGLDIAGIDITSTDISVPLYKNGGAVIEVNAAPGIRMHLYPSEGKPQKVEKDIVDMLFPEGSQAIIPIISVTGTNGKTTTTRMIGQILRAYGLSVGMTTTSGIYINDQCILKGDNTGPVSAQIVLGHRNVEAAVLETARGGIIRKGLGYDLADVGVITNITEDHLGIDGIWDLESLAHVKSLVVEAIKPDGYAVLNADDLTTLAIRERVKNSIIYFSKTHDNPLMLEHLQKGGIGVYIKENTIFIQKANEIIPVINVHDIPATYKGYIECNVENSLSAVSAAYALKVPVEIIVKGLKTFCADIHSNPGRFNFFELGDIKILVDYAHNIAGYRAVLNSVKRLPHKKLTGVIGMPGDRLEKHIRMVGELCGANFDYIYIKEDKELRTRARGEVAKILHESVLKSGMPMEKVSIIYDEVQALQKAVMEAKPGEIIVIFYEKFDSIVSSLKKLQKKLNKHKDKKNLILKQSAV